MNNIKEKFQTILLLFKSRFVLFLVSLLFVVILLDIIFPLPALKQYSKTVYAKDGTLLSAYLSKDEKWRMRTRLDEVSPDLIKAIIKKEDDWFYLHPGVNPFSMIRAVFQNIFSGKRISGASTITMQVARMLEPADRTYINKFLEILRALQLELHFSKDEILEIYLSHLPYGGNIEGVKSASYIYFNRPPDKLSLSQSVLLAIIPNNPNRFRLDKEAATARKERNKWINIFKEKEVFDSKNLYDAFEEQVGANRYTIKNEAAHFCMVAVKRYKEDQIYSSLDLSIQRSAEKILLSYVNRNKTKQVSNGAVIIIDNKTNSIVAYCGSADFYDNTASGQVNGITAIRSPGSTLKPILYSLAFDLGELTTEMKLLDIPTDFGGYEPDNFDLKFNGQVTAKYALANSLNIPAVRLLQKIGMDKFVSLLQRGGFYDIARNKKSLGLSLILGGCGVRLEQLTRFFTVYSQSGKLFPLNYLREVSIESKRGIKIFSEGAAYLTGMILTSNERPDYPTEFLFSSEHPLIAWKTGTSYGKRDAWAIGFNPDYTIGVWMGNFDGKGSPELSGAGMAVPLLFEFFNSIDSNPKKLWFDKPKGVYQREVCSETGLLPTETCKHKIADYYLENISPNKKCDLYKTLYVNEDETIQYCPGCLPKDGYKKVDYPFYDSELMLWFIKNKYDVKRPPPHNPFCQVKFSGDGPRILSPSPDYEYYLEESSNQQILLQAVSDPSVKIHYWYIDNVFYRKTKPEEKVFFDPSNGKIEIACLDDFGRKTSIEIKVVFY